MKKISLLALTMLSFTLSAQTPTIIGGKPITLNSDSSIIFKVNNTQAGVITSGTNMSLGYQSLISNTTGINNTAVGNRSLFSTTTGFRNIGLGTQAGEGITSGTEDIAIGYQSMQPDYNNVTGNRNVAVGNHSLFGNSSSPSAHSGNDNTAVGHVALGGEVDGSFNTAIGSGSLRNHTNGSNNTAIGFNTLYNNITGSGNVAIGYQAAQNETGSNKLYIANSNTTTPLIGGDFSAKIVTVNGALQINSATDTVSSSVSGSVLFSQPIRGNTKKVVIYLNSANGTATYTFPEPFSYVPGVFTTPALSSGVIVSLSTSSVTVTGSTTTGVLVLEGY